MRCFEISFGIKINRKNKRAKLYSIYKQQRGYCFYCRCKTQIAKSGVMFMGNEPKNLATIEHIYHRRDLRRAIENKLVMACYNCNQKRNMEYETFYKSFEITQPIMDIRNYIKFSKKRK